jgi:hypothetical protein
MIELFALVLVLTGIVRMARTRGASPWLYGLTAGIGWFVVGVFVTVVVGGVLVALGYEGNGITGFTMRLSASVSQWLWVGLVALHVRYRVGRGVEGPSGSWSCQSCRSINQSYALKCDTCGAAFSNARVS